MKISAKGRYALRIMVDIATADKEYVSITEIANRQEISVKYLEQIIAKLLKANLLTSLRGSLGGYKLVKTPQEYSLEQILRVTGDLPQLAPCSNSGNCPRLAKCTTAGCYVALSGLIMDFLAKTTLQDLVDKTFAVG